MITQKALLLDLSYYFKGKVRLSAFFLSLIIGIQEEFIFRYYLFQHEYPILLLLIAGSICFGLIHISFSGYDVFSKAVLGAIC
ncbi:CPBP family intramembrane glutamic endopeptidase [Bacillus xiapuensis]|uniref:CPBP family intramembrane glutamic endopeptidase n=1 Tax=Bacillus xiapuensis TaxID=2014075 RepID=UPI0038B9A36D